MIFRQSLPHSIKAVLLVSICFSLDAQEQASTLPKPLTRFEKLRDGDLVFIASSSKRAKLIETLTHSKFSHCGVVFLDAQGKPQVYEGAGANSDVHKPIEQWRKDESTPYGGRPDSPLHPVYVRRLVTGLTQDQLNKVKSEAAKLHHTKYDFAFYMGDPEDNLAGREYIYCSELLYRAFQSVGVLLGEPRRFSFYRAQAGQNAGLMDSTMNCAEARNLRNPPRDYSPDEFVISPQDVYSSEKLRDVNDETP
jgi:hypothetical protein